MAVGILNSHRVVQKARFFATTFMIVLWSLTVNQAWLLFPIFQFFSAHKTWRILVNYVQRLWAHVIFLMAGRARLVLHGETIRPTSRPRIVIANHVTDVDWIPLWRLSTVDPDNDRSGHVKIMLKEAIKYVPIMGWGCRLFGFIFLKRNWAEDRHTIESQVADLVKHDLPLWVLIFP
jgi:1-acyl-sn-glycerol-3-phosphate acyltransferase